MALRSELPPGYWRSAKYHYFHDHDVNGGWTVEDRISRFPLAGGLDRNVAAAIACLLNGDIDLAMLFLHDLMAVLPLVPSTA